MRLLLVSALSLIAACGGSSGVFCTPWHSSADVASAMRVALPYDPMRLPLTLGFDRGVKMAAWLKTK
jgi:hypothetical protein